MKTLMAVMALTLGAAAGGEPPIPPVQPVGPAQVRAGLTTEQKLARLRKKIGTLKFQIEITRGKIKDLDRLGDDKGIRPKLVERLEQLPAEIAVCEFQAAYLRGEVTRAAVEAEVKAAEEALALALKNAGQAMDPAKSAAEARTKLQPAIDKARGRLAAIEAIDAPNPEF